MARHDIARGGPRVASVADCYGLPSPMMHPYEDLLRDMFEHGMHKTDRTGTGTRSVFGRQIRFDLAEGFPLITTKRVHFKSIAYELLWFLRGESNVALAARERRDDLGRVGRRRRRARPGLRRAVALVADAVGRADRPDQPRSSSRSGRTPIRAASSSRRGTPPTSRNMALAPCHALFQFYVADGKLSCQLYQRSADMFLGVPFNIASYALLTHMVAAAGRSRARRLRLDRRRLPHLRQPRRAGHRAAHPRAVPAADAAHRRASRDSIFDYTLRGLRASRTTSTTRPSAAPSPYDRHREPRPHLGAGARRRHRRGGRDAVARARGPRPLQGAHPRRHRRHGPQDLGLAARGSGRCPAGATSSSPATRSGRPTAPRSCTRSTTPRWPRARPTGSGSSAAPSSSPRIDRADRLEVTELDLDVDGDTFAPPIGGGGSSARALASLAHGRPLPLPPLRPPP